MAKSIETRAGLSPSEKNLPFSITTSQAEEYLQKKVDVLCNRDNSLPKNVDVRLYTMNMGSKFLPFIVVLPLSVLVSNEKEKNEIDPIFSNTERGGVQMIEKPFHEMFKAYVYNKEDVKGFDSNDWRHARGVSRQCAEQMRRTATPRISSFGGSGRRQKYVTFLIDPIRLFHDMLVIVDDRRDFLVDIVNWQKMKNGEYKYFIERCTKKNRSRGKGDDNIANQLNALMRGGR